LSDILVKIRDLHFSRGERKIFNGISLNIPRQGITAIMGPSGSGKTTLLKLIGGQLTPEKGSIEVDGLDVHQLPTKKLFELRKRMGMLFQSGALLTDLSVFENVAYPLREHTKLNNAMIRYLVLLKLNAVGLRGAANLMPSELSGGMSRRVALARAVALDPMNGKDRRAIHVALRDEDGIATMSVGEGQYRQVVVVPEGADEYEEALQRSEEAARADD